MDWNAVNWIMNATEMTTTFFMMRPEGDLGDAAALIRSNSDDGDIFVIFVFLPAHARQQSRDSSQDGLVLRLAGKAHMQLRYTYTSPPSFARLIQVMSSFLPSFLLSSHIILAPPFLKFVVRILPRIALL